MPLKLVPPREGRSPNYTIRGTYLRVYVDRSAGSRDKRVAQQALNAIKRDIESGAFVAPSTPTFESVALAYMQAGGERRFLAPVLQHFAGAVMPLDQAAIDAAATTLYPTGTPATRNRNVYTPVSAVHRHGGYAIVLKRPKGAQGERRTDYLTAEQLLDVLGVSEKADAEWHAFLTLLAYTGLRLGEALALRCDKLDLGGSRATVGKTKNGEARTVHLPPVVVAALGNHPRGLDRGDSRVFPVYAKSAMLNGWLRATCATAGVTLPEGLAFHIFRHTYGTLMRQHGGLTREGLVETGAWRSSSAAGRYDHADVSAAARAADLLPVRRKA